jgi:hypothetical protein
VACSARKLLLGILKRKLASRDGMFVAGGSDATFDAG